MSLARAVADIFGGTSGTGMWGTSGTAGNAFSVARSSVRNQMGLIPEPDSNCYNAPVDILIVYPLDTVS